MLISKKTFKIYNNTILEFCENCQNFKLFLSSSTFRDSFQKYFRLNQSFKFKISKKQLFKSVFSLNLAKSGHLKTVKISSFVLR